MYTRPIVAESGYTYKRRVALNNRREARKEYNYSCCSSNDNYRKSNTNTSCYVEYDFSPSVNISTQNYEDSDIIKPMRFPLIYD